MLRLWSEAMRSIQFKPQRRQEHRGKSQGPVEVRASWCQERSWAKQSSLSPLLFLVSAADMAR
jgi:hypothetical protein